jgi:hypothetical protein
LHEPSIYAYLGETFELCKIPISSRRSKKVKPLGSQYQFTVRCLDRYEDKKLYSEHTKRWKGIRQDLENNNSPIDLDGKCAYLKSIDRTINWDVLYTKWQRDNFYAINVIDELPMSIEEREEYFDSFLLSGVPISLWNRCPEVKCSVDDDNYTVEQKFKELLNIEYFNDLSQIFKKIYQFRQDAHNTGDLAKNYLGYYLGFICDRPDPIPSNLRDRLNQRGLQGSN